MASLREFRIEDDLAAAEQGAIEVTLSLDDGWVAPLSFFREIV